MNYLNKGFSLLEIILAVALAGIFIPAIAMTLSLGLQSSSQGENFTKAQALAQEGMEKIYQRKSLINGSNWDWTNNLPAEGTAEQTISGKFTLKAKFEKIDSTILYSKSRKITVSVSWKENSPSGNDNQNITLVSYVSAH